MRGQAAVTLLGILALSSVVIADRSVGQDSRPNTRLISPQQLPLGTPDLKTREPTSDDAEKEAIRLYAEAREKLDLGDLDGGQRYLERLVGRYPDTLTATVARRDLKRLYTRSPSTPQPAQVPPAILSTSPPAQAAVVPSAQEAAAPNTAATPAPTAPTVTALPQPRHPPRVHTHSDVVDRANTDLRHSAGDRLFFSDSSAEVGTRSRSAIEAMAQWLRRNPGVEIIVEGHADDRGNEAVNAHLAAQRAETVRLRLIDLGVAPARVAAIGLGREQPIADCRESLCSAQNRRVVVVVTQVSGTYAPQPGGPGAVLRPDLKPEPPTSANAPVYPGGGVTAVRR